MNHGLITWGQTAREAYDRHIELVTKAEKFVFRVPLPVTRASSPGRQGPGHGQRNTEHIAAKLHGSLNKILEFDDSPDVLAFLAREDAERITRIGAATPD